MMTGSAGSGSGNNGWGNAGSAGWWTPEHQSHAVDRLMKEAGLSEDGAKALVSRWKNVESPNGPDSVNRFSGAVGIAQGLGSRRSGYLGSFDDQLTNAARELNGPEARAKGLLNTPSMAATGASQFERAEGYDPGTGRDNFTDRTAYGMAGITHATGQGTPAERGDVGKSPFGVVGDRAYFEAQQRRIDGNADKDDVERMRLYHEQHAQAGTAIKSDLLAKSRRYFAWTDRAAKLDDGSDDVTTVDRREAWFAQPEPAAAKTTPLPHPQSHWTKLSDNQVKDDRLSGHLQAIHETGKSGNAMLHDALMGAISAKTAAQWHRMTSDDDMATAVKAARGDSLNRKLEEDRRHRDQEKTKPNGLNFDQYHTKRWHDIHITNETGANVSQIAGPASY